MFSGGEVARAVERPTTPGTYQVTVKAENAVSPTALQTLRITVS